MAVSVNVKFDDEAGGDITIPGPVPGSRLINVLHQAVGLSAGGTRYAYDKGVELFEVDLDFVTLSTTDKEALTTFFATTIVGVKTTWKYTDTGGNIYTARFLNTRLDFEKVAKNVYSVSMRLELATMGK